MRTVSIAMRRIVHPPGSLAAPSTAVKSTSRRRLPRLDSIFLQLPQMHVRLLHPSVSYYRIPSIQLHHFCAVVVFKSIVERKPSPRDPMRIGLLIRVQAALAAIGLKWIMFAHDHFQLAVTIQIGHCNRVRRAHPVDDVYFELAIAQVAGVLQPTD